LAFFSARIIFNDLKTSEQRLNHNIIPVNGKNDELFYMNYCTLTTVACKVSRFISVWIFLNNSNEVLVPGILYKA
jgi:hypothetical protein